MTEPTSPGDDLTERVARELAQVDVGVEWSLLWSEEAENYLAMARAAIAALAPELNNADLTARAFALKVRDAKQAGKDAVPVKELDEVIAAPYRVVMK